MSKGCCNGGSGKEKTLEPRDLETCARLVLRNLDKPDVDFREMIKECLDRYEMLSSTEQVKVDLAMAFWNQTRAGTFAKALERFGPADMEALIEALVLFNSTLNPRSK